MADSEKTEKATPKKRRDERKKGNIFFSNDAVSVVVLLAGLATLFLTIGGSAEKIQGFMRQCIEITQSEAGTADFRNLLRSFYGCLSKLLGRCWASPLRQVLRRPSLRRRC